METPTGSWSYLCGIYSREPPSPLNNLLLKSWNSPPTGQGCKALIQEAWTISRNSKPSQIFTSFTPVLRKRSKFSRLLTWGDLFSTSVYKLMFLCHRNMWICSHHQKWGSGYFLLLHNIFFPLKCFQYCCKHSLYFIFFQGNSEATEKSQLLDRCGSGSGPFLPVYDDIWRPHGFCWEGQCGALGHAGHRSQ